MWSDLDVEMYWLRELQTSREITAPGQVIAAGDTRHQATSCPWCLAFSQMF